MLCCTAGNFPHNWFCETNNWYLPHDWRTEIPWLHVKWLSLTEVLDHVDTIIYHRSILSWSQDTNFIASAYTQFNSIHPLSWEKCLECQRAWETCLECQCIRIWVEWDEKQVWYVLRKWFQLSGDWMIKVPLPIFAHFTFGLQTKEKFYIGL